MAEPYDLPRPYSVKRDGVSVIHCDAEPVITPGCIQGHGMLIALRPSDLVVSQVSENCLRIIGHPPSELVGQPIAAAIGESAATALQRFLHRGAVDAGPVYVLTFRPRVAAAVSFDLSVHRHDDVLLLEFEPSHPEDTQQSRADFLGMLRTTVLRLRDAPSLGAFCDLLADETRRVTGLDRAMVYRFHADDSGEVLSDAHRADLPSWRGLRYPASDIPRPAREIFKRIGVRPLPDAGGELCEMVPLLNPDTLRPLDMTYCALRGPSVMYTEYLQNMGVAASLTMPILA